MCVRCRRGGGLVQCSDCDGGGLLKRGGYQRSNPVSMASILQSKWTSGEDTFGWRHFVVLNKRRDKGHWFVEMQSTCEPTVRFWINSANLKDRGRWTCG